jgi:hypothetical protein
MAKLKLMEELALAAAAGQKIPRFFFFFKFPRCLL